jgi:hypothetical protein
MLITADLLFSYWLLFWFIFYLLFRNYSQYIQQYANPILSIIIAAVINLFICLLVFMRSMRSKNYSGLLIFIGLNIIIKIIPIILLIREPIHIFYNLFNGFVVFTLYNIYLYYKNTNILRIYDATIDSIVNGKNNTPIFHAIHYLHTL